MAFLALSGVSEILGGTRVLRKELHSVFDYIELVAQGVPKSALIRLAEYLDLSIGQISQLLPVSERTIQRYPSDQRCSGVVSEHILHLATVAARGSEVFGDRENFLSWLNQPSVALGNRVPLDLLNSRFGADMVLEELGRMEHGVFS
ncbi:MAG: DUF2384 domain-containing protein [bacterium]|nr:DUF2384 domain-containing protein [bacterium]